MSFYKKVGVLFLISIVFYLIGNWLPIQQLRPTVQSTTLKTPEYLQLIIGSISAFVTLFAVFIALFKEEVVKYWRFSKIVISMPDEEFFEELNSNLGSSDSVNKPIEAINYNCRVDVVNSGSISAFDLEICLESLTFKSEEHPTTQILKNDPKFIKWNDSSEVKINLSPEGKRTLDILKLSSPTQQSSPQGDSKNIPAKLKIAGIDINPVYKKGKFIGSFAISSKDAKIVRFKLEVDWNGRWENRATEMKNNLKIDLKK